MRSLVTAVIAAIEAVTVALAGLLFVAVPALLIWVLAFNLAAEPAEVASISTAVWLLAHFVPLTLSLTEEAALGFGLSAEPLSFGVSLAPLGITLLTVWLACRAGWRLAPRGGIGAAGVLGGTVGFAAMAATAAVFAGDRLAWPMWAAILVPALVYGVSCLTCFVLRAALDAQPWWDATVRALQRAASRLSPAFASGLPARAAETLRLAVLAFALLVALAAVAFTAAILFGYAEAIALTQQLQIDPLGSVLLFLVQLALLPVALIWSAAWLTGSGFALGIGTSVTPFETLLGPLPALPIFGLIPDGWGAFGALAPAALVVGGLVIGALSARRGELRRAERPTLIAVPVLAAVLVGFAVAALCALASGSIGPDRLAVAGPAPWAVGGLAAAELGCGMLLGALAARIDVVRLKQSVPAAASRLREAAPAAAARLRESVPTATERMRSVSGIGGGSAERASSGASERDADPERVLPELPTTGEVDTRSSGGSAATADPARNSDKSRGSRNSDKPWKSRDSDESRESSDADEQGSEDIFKDLTTGFLGAGAAESKSGGASGSGSRTAALASAIADAANLDARASTEVPAEEADQADRAGALGFAGERSGEAGSEGESRGSEKRGGKSGKKAKKTRKGLKDRGGRREKSGDASAGLGSAVAGAGSGGAGFFDLEAPSNPDSGAEAKQSIGSDASGGARRGEAAEERLRGSSEAAEPVAATERGALEPSDPAAEEGGAGAGDPDPREPEATADTHETASYPTEELLRAFSWEGTQAPTDSGSRRERSE
ncbi:MAG: DUF6350 family protein [Leucobacter sp.]